MYLKYEREVEGEKVSLERNSEVFLSSIAVQPTWMKLNVMWDFRPESYKDSYELVRKELYLEPADCCHSHNLWRNAHHRLWLWVHLYLSDTAFFFPISNSYSAVEANTWESASCLTVSDR